MVVNSNTGEMGTLYNTKWHLLSDLLNPAMLWLTLVGEGTMRTPEINEISFKSLLNQTLHLYILTMDSLYSEIKGKLHLYIILFVTN